MRWNKKGDVAVDESTENIMYWVIGIPIVLIMIGMSLSLADRADVSKQLDLQSNYYEFLAMSSVRDGNFFYYQNNENTTITNNYISLRGEFDLIEIPVYVNADTDDFEHTLNENLEFSKNSISIRSINDCENKIPKKINVVFDFAFQNDRSNALKQNIESVLASNGYSIDSSHSFRVVFRDYQMLNSQRDLFEDNDILVSELKNYCGDFFITDLADVEVQIADQEALYLVGEFFDE